MSTRIVVIGAGPGGVAAAVRAAQRGAEVTVIERENVGGTCLNWGCVPSKVLITTAGMLERFKRAEEFGIRLEGRFSPDMDLLMTRKQKVIQDQAKGLLDTLSRHKIEYLSGDAVLTAPGTLEARKSDGIKKVQWDKLILALGTRPSAFPSLPFDGERILSSNDLLSLHKLPRSAMILGGGVIGCEFASILGSLGSEVTIVEALDRLLPLPSVDEDCSKVLQREMKKQKIKFILNSTVQSVEHADGGLRVTTLPFPVIPGAKPVKSGVDALVVCVGRKPNTEGTGLSAIGLATDEKGWIPADDRMKTNVPGVYAIGDVLGPDRIMLAHVASTEGVIAAENAMGHNLKLDYRAIPSAIFTSPEVACVGLTEAQARDLGHPFRTDTALFRSVGKAQVIGEIAGEAKIISNSENGKVLGAHVVGPHSTELIAECTLAVKSGLTVRDLAETIHAHPTLSEVILEAAFRSVGR